MTHRLLKRQVTLQLHLGRSCDVGILLGASLLHVAQSSVGVDEVLLHLVHSLGKDGGEVLEHAFISTDMVLLSPMDA